MMLVLAHRGFHARHPENTLAAFEAAIALGCHGIETDVRTSADGEAILVHDRIAPNGKPVSQQSRKQLEDAFGHEIPLLEHALSLDSEILWNIEIKTPSGWQAALPVLTDAALTHRLLISSFHHSIAIEAAKELNLASAFLSASEPSSINTLLYGAQNYKRLRHIVWDYEILNFDQVRQCNALGFRNFVYGVKTAQEVALCRSYGVHGIILDDPMLALPDA